MKYDEMSIVLLHFYKHLHFEARNKWRNKEEEEEESRGNVGVFLLAVYCRQPAPLWKKEIVTYA